jgi:hypothetical protein
MVSFMNQFADLGNNEIGGEKEREGKVRRYNQK